MKKFMTRDGDRETLDAFIALALGGLAANPQSGMDMMKGMALYQKSGAEVLGESAVGLAIGAMKAREAYLSGLEQNQGLVGPATQGGSGVTVQPGGERLADSPPGVEGEAPQSRGAVS